MPPHCSEVGLSRPSSGLPAASPGTTQGLKWAPPGPAPASRLPVEAQPLSPSWRPLQAQPFPFLLPVTTGPMPASQQETSVASAPAELPPAFVDPNLSPARLCRPTFCLTVACTDPALPGEQLLQAPRLPPRGLSSPSSHLTAASWGQVPACLPPGILDKPSSSCTMACFGRIDASCGLPRCVSSCLTLASLGLRLPHASLLGPSSCLSWPLQAKPLPVGSLSRSSLYLAVGPLRVCLLPHSGPIGPRSCPSVASEGPATASKWPP
ncbi:PREDICTED: LOW QUALITY PROTEIN: putative uncharacterized protein FLJ46235 [Cercocebus atys]|uniref:LOW QUALITY PROTEIN: putative uncharacterized protein FLJ46235 n=1 Tax=Cercocebus atys TaxID=9531 RepID=UPI0005F517B7|nr:PREDICTED: LOW QUALITY PROTEIN: putative uncharacterized protein FLJ46235 [Cercocebus atys]